jgi:hypothetical protein
MMPKAIAAVPASNSTTMILSPLPAISADTCRPSGPLQACSSLAHTGAVMGFNKRKMEDRRRKAAEQEAAARRALGPQIIEDSVKLVETWRMPARPRTCPCCSRQRSRRPLRPAIGFLRARCPACRTTGDVDLRTFDWHRGAAVTALTPALSCRSCRPNAPFAELLSLSKSSLAEEYYAERSGNKWVSE